MILKKKNTDKLWQWAYIIAYKLLQIYWYVFRPASHGACVALWHNGQVLLIRNSYKKEYTVPGGNVASGETSLNAAVRELFEEVNIRINPNDLKFVGDFISPNRFKLDKVSLFEIFLKEQPVIQIDNREVIWAGFMPPENALKKKIIFNS